MLWWGSNNVQKGMDTALQHSQEWRKMAKCNRVPRSVHVETVKQWMLWKCLGTYVGPENGGHERIRPMKQSRHSWLCNGYVVLMNFVYWSKQKFLTLILPSSSTSETPPPHHQTILSNAPLLQMCWWYLQQMMSYGANKVEHGNWVKFNFKVQFHLVYFSPHPMIILTLIKIIKNMIIIIIII